MIWGRRDEQDLQSLALSPALLHKLKPYLGLRSAATSNFLKQHPLTITALPAREIDAAVTRSAVRLLRLRYQRASSNTRMTDFFDLPPQAQTVIASVSFQYGNLALRTPNFWNAVTSQNWTRAVTILRQFGDRYRSRRNAEAKLLERLVQ